MVRREEKIENILKMKPPLISVIMPVYNAVPYLRESINSILSQQYDNFEFLIIDDLSEDHSLEIIKSYKDSRIKLIQKDVHSGYTHSLNQGIEIAKGKYLCRMDADDISLPNRFQRQVAHMEAHPQVAVCGTWVDFFYTNQLEARPKREVRNQTEHKQLVFNLFFGIRDGMCYHSSIVLRRDFFLEHQLRYDPDYQPAEDNELWTRVSLLGQFACVPEVLVYYRVHDQQTSKKRADQLIKKYESAQKKGIQSVLNLEATEDELELHIQIIRRKYTLSLDFIKKAEKWLLKLYQTNLERNFFDQFLLEAHLGKVWNEIIYQSTYFGLDVYQIYHKSPLSRLQPTGLRNKWQLLWDCWQKRPSPYIYKSFKSKY